MAKIKLTKGELKRQRDQLKQFRHYLPTLQLKKQQLQIKILEARQQRDAITARKEQALTQFARWRRLLDDPWLQHAFGKETSRAALSAWLKPVRVVVEHQNIAGAFVPYLQDVIFSPLDYSLAKTPFWLDMGLRRLQELVKLILEEAVAERRIEVLQKELRVTTQRVNLFEKVKIPECLENIRRIRIYLGDQMANAVGISKVAKAKTLAAQGLG